MRRARAVKGPEMVAPTESRKSGRTLAAEPNHPFQLTGSMLGARPHICAFFNTPDDEYRALLPFIKEGLAIGEKAIHTVDPGGRSHHIERLASAGLDVDSLCRKG